MRNKKVTFWVRPCRSHPFFCSVHPLAGSIYRENKVKIYRIGRIGAVRRTKAMTNIVKADQLTKTFGKVKALDHCDLEIKKRRDLRIPGTLRGRQDDYHQAPHRAASQ